MGFSTCRFRGGVLLAGVGPGMGAVVNCMVATVLHVHLILLALLCVFQLNMPSSTTADIRQRQLEIVTEARSQRHSQLFNTLRGLDAATPFSENRLAATPRERTRRWRLNRQNARNLQNSKFFYHFDRLIIIS